ncbi:hypothetical protein IAR50_006104 [Cryptococcus sp. DSM 104548]
MTASASTAGFTSNNTSVNVYIPPASPLLAYSPGRNGVSGTSWVQVQDGSSQCEGSGTFAVDVDGLYFSNIAFFYSVSSSYTVQARLDGSLSRTTSDQGVATLTPSSFGNHTARLECSGDQGGSEDFQLTGVILQTEVVDSGTPSNATLDDASSEITYTGFQSTSSPSSSSISAINKGDFYKDTISYTSSGDATAAFTFTGSALYIFGMTGPDFGCFSITIDSSSCGTFNASTTISTSSTLLFFTTYLDPDAKHQVEITNLEDGMVLALDYFVAVSPQSSSSGSGTASASGTTSANADGSSATAVWGDGGTSGGSASGGDSTASVIGGILGGLAGLALIWLYWAYRRWKISGGEGSFFAALCGKAKGKPAPPPPPEKKEWPLWPMMWSRPKYAVPSD